MSSSESSSASSVNLKRGVKRKRELNSASSKAKNVAVAAWGSSSSEPSSSGDSDSDSGSDSDGTEDEKGHGDAAPQEPEVLSHAAQRKLKKKAKHEAKQLESSTNQDQPHTDSANALLPKRQNSIWVGNLTFKTTEQALRAFFQREVKGCEVTRVNMPTKPGRDFGHGRGMKGENRGFAYVDFATKEDKEKAITLSEQHLDGRKLLIKDGDDFKGRPPAGTSEKAVTVESGTASTIATSMVGKSKTAQRILATQKQPPAPCLFLGNLGFQATEQSIREMIERHMKSRQKNREAENPDSMVDKKVLRKVRIGTFEDSGLCKGFAFVDFATTEDATSVLLDPRNHHLDGRKLVMEYASADAVRRGGGPGAKAHRHKQENREKDNDRGHRTAGPRHDDAKSVMTLKDEVEGKVPKNADEPPSKKMKREEGRHRDGGKARRSKPGAALALARREKVAIVPSSGKKIVF